MSDWADDKAAETMAAILNPGVTLDQAAEFMAATFRLVEAQGVERGLNDAARVVQEVFAS